MAKSQAEAQEGVFFTTSSFFLSPKNGSLSDKGFALRKVGSGVSIALLESLLLCKFAAAVTLSQATQALSHFTGKQEGSSFNLALS